MAPGKALSDDLRDVLLYMAQSLDISSITHYTGCKRRTIEQILADYRCKGTTARQPLRKMLQGRKRAMKDQDVRVREWFLIVICPNQWVLFRAVSTRVCSSYTWCLPWWNAGAAGDTSRSCCWNGHCLESSHSKWIYNEEGKFFPFVHHRGW